MYFHKKICTLCRFVELTTKKNDIHMSVCHFFIIFTRFLILPPFAKRRKRRGVSPVRLPERADSC